MAGLSARLYIRGRLDDGSRPYFDPHYAANGKMKRSGLSSTASRNIAPSLLLPPLFARQKTHL